MNHVDIELYFEEVTTSELDGNVRDFLEGVSVGLGMVGSAAAIVALT